VNGDAAIRLPRTQLLTSEVAKEGLRAGLDVKFEMEAACAICTEVLGVVTRMS
jgi:hypothetical protein